MNIKKAVIESNGERIKLVETREQDAINEYHKLRFRMENK